MPGGDRLRGDRGRLRRGRPRAALRSPFDLALLDLRLEAESGLDLLPALLAARPGLDVVLVTAYAALDTAVEAMRRGAADYLPKPFTPAQIRHVVEQVGRRRAIQRRVAELEETLAGEVPALLLHGRFREDLLFRLNVLEVAVPPLRERTEDIGRLARAFLDFFARAAGRRPPELDPAAEAALLAHDWPGNVRELRNAMERAVILWPAQILTPEALPQRISARATNRPVLGGDATLDEIEREHVLQVIARAPTLDDAARILGIDASTLWRKRKKYETA